MKLWVKKLIIIVVINIIYMLPLACHHHKPAPPQPPQAENPANYKYASQLITEHQPGFFSCAYLDGVWLGTYQDYHHKMHCQLCKLVDNRINVIKELPGESIYNIRGYENYLMLPVEQGSLWRYDIGANFYMIHPQHLRMGHYDFQWTDYGWITSEKDTITTENTSQLWKSGQKLYQTSDFTWKEFVVKDNITYVAAYFVWKHTEAGMLTVNIETGEPNLVHSERWGNYCIVGKDADGVIWYAIQFGKSAKIYKYPNTLVQEIDNIPWRFKLVNGIFCLLMAENGWRKDGPSYFYVLNTETQRFELKLTFQDAELWDVCGDDINHLYAVTRNENEGNLGRVYLITVTK